LMPDADDERIRSEAADWFARMRAPGASRDPVFDAWRAEPAHQSAYDRLVRHWDRTAFLAQTATGRDRDLSRVARWSRAQIGALAAVFLVMIAVGISLLANRQSSQQLEGAPHDIRGVALSDGSHMVLDAGAKVRVDYAANERRIWLDQGRARFVVAHQADRPFIVGVGGGEVIAHGTIFDVSLERTGARVALLRGSIEVRSAPKMHGEMLVAGQQTLFVSHHNPNTPVPLAAADTTWANGIVTFSATPLSDAAAALNRYNGLQLKVADPAIGALRITGGFKIHDPQGFAQAAAAMFALDIAHPDVSTIELRPKK
jgi:transmembrane sensor